MRQVKELFSQMRNIYRKLKHEVTNGFVGDNQNNKLGAHDKSMAKLDSAKKVDENAKA
jgi:hypothetical protein